jgi:hypothetical protein
LEVLGRKFISVSDGVEHVAEIKGISVAAAKWRVRHDRVNATAPPKPGQGTCKTPAYKSWSGIIHCRTNPISKQFEPGLEVSDRWRVFERFLTDVGQPPGKGYALVRLDKGRGYFPDNCTWVTRSEASKLNAARMKAIGTLVGNRRYTAISAMTPRPSNTTGVLVRSPASDRT